MDKEIQKQLEKEQKDIDSVFAPGNRVEILDRWIYDLSYNHLDLLLKCKLPWFYEEEPFTTNDIETFFMIGQCDDDDLICEWYWNPNKLKRQVWLKKDRINPIEIKDYAFAIDDYLNSIFNYFSSEDKKKQSDTDGLTQEHN